MNVYSLSVDYNTNYDLKEIICWITHTINADKYDGVLSVIEYVCRAIYELRNNATPFFILNSLFEREYVGYRFIDGYITPITNDNETDSIQKAVDNSSDQVKEHFRKALMHISNREMPDYENSIKESISAVEAECNLIYGQNGSLGETLSKIEKEQKVHIHPALKEAFNKLYGYTSDGKGIRHAGTIGGTNATFAEAEFMLVSCSAFVNYLRCNIAE